MNKLLSSILASAMLLSTLGTSFAQETTQTTTFVDESPVGEIFQDTLSTSALSVDAAKAYIDIVNSTTQKYGVATEQNKTNTATKGVFHSQILDMDGDGTFELLVAYLDSVTMGYNNTQVPELSGSIEVYGYTGAVAEKIGTVGIHSYGNPVDGVHYILGNNGNSWQITKQEHTFLAGLGSIDLAMTYSKIGTKLQEQITEMETSFSNNYTGHGDVLFSCYQDVTYSVQSCLPELERLVTPTYPDWTSPYIDFVSDDIMPDITTENFESASDRGQIAQWLYNMSGDTGSYSSHFTDAGDYANAIGWCYENGVMSGSSETWFNAEGKVSRQEFALILKQMATVLGKTTLSGDISTLEGYSDAWSISSWAQEGVAWAVTNQLMMGSNNALNPNGDVTRLEVAIMLKALSQL